jgi:hypothetical protein
MEWILDNLFGWFFDLLYGLQRSICYLIDFICEVFAKLVGLDTVSIDGGQEDLLTHFIQSPAIRSAFLGITLVGFILLIVFVIVAILKRNTEGRDKKTNGQILGRAMQCFLTLVVIPFLVLAGIVFANTVMGAIDASMTASVTGALDAGGGTSFGGQILVTSGSGAYIGGGNRAVIEQQFINGTLDYNNLAVVKQYYDLSEMNFFVGIGSGLVLLVMFALSAITFIQRLFDICLLYIVSPVSAATIPLDDGQRFKIWREMLVSKILGAYGIILAMNLFFLIIPQVTHVQFFDNSFKNGVVGVLFLIGGAFAVMKANLVIAQLTGNNAGTQEAQQMLASIHGGMRLVRGGMAVTAGVAGRLVGGSDYIRNKKHGMGVVENLETSAKSDRNRKPVNKDDKPRTKGQKAATATRLSTMPAGVLKDILQGGLITAGKNFVPRLKNAFGGRSVVSRAEVKPRASAPVGGSSGASASNDAAKPNTSAESPLISADDIDGAATDNKQSAPVIMPDDTGFDGASAGKALPDGGYIQVGGDAAGSGGAVSMEFTTGIANASACSKPAAKPQNTKLNKKGGKSK